MLLLLFIGAGTYVPPPKVGKTRYGWRFVLDPIEPPKPDDDDAIVLRIL